MTTKRELLNNALTLFRWVALQVSQGNTIAALRPDGSMAELQMPCLESIALRGKPKLELVSTTQNMKSKARTSSRAA